MKKIAIKKHICSIDDLRAYVKRYEYWQISGDGELDWYCDSTDVDSKDIEYFTCEHCGEEFMDFKQAKKHCEVSND